MFDSLRQEAGRIGKPAWRGLLQYTVTLHEKSVRTDKAGFPYDWEEIGPGYCYGPAYGHWDTIHQIMDVMPTEPEHAKKQLLNILALQQPDGLVPGAFYLRNGKLSFHKDMGHPPVWVVAADRCYNLTKDRAFLSLCFDALKRQIEWFEKNRTAANGGFYYQDILDRRWESGVDEGIRFDGASPGKLTCTDATAHVWQMYDYAALWTAILNEPDSSWPEKKKELSLVINSLFDEKTAWYYDGWKIQNPEKFPESFEGMWPFAVGAAPKQDAYRLVHENLLNPSRFFSAHPITTVSMQSPRFEFRMWRGPSWNSMTYWAVIGCLKYGFTEESVAIVERVLDFSADIYEKTGTIWEFYHPFGKDPGEVARKPDTPFNVPCRDYAGHNPLIDFARIWEAGK